VYYNISELTNLAANLQAKTAASSAPLLNSMLNIPSFDGFSEASSSLLPQNIIQVKPDGLEFLPNPTLVDNALREGIAGIKSSIDRNATALFNSVAGKTVVNPQGVVTQIGFDNTINTLATISQQFSKITSSQVINLFNINTKSYQYGTINNAVESAFQQNAKLSPKAIRDLNDSTFFENKILKTVSDAQTNTYNASYQMTANSVNSPTFSKSSQNNLQQISSPQFSGSNEEGYDVYVRRTVYWAYGPGTDYDSAALRSSTGRRLEEGISVAVDPAFIPYLSRVVFPDIGTRYATDTGGAVKARTASGGTAPVIDVFFFNKNDALIFANKNKDYITVKVYPPKSPYKYAANSSPNYGVA